MYVKHYLILITLIHLSGSLISAIRITGFRVEVQEKHVPETYRQGRVTTDGTIIFTHENVSLRLYGSDLKVGALLRFTSHVDDLGMDCIAHGSTNVFTMTDVSTDATSALVSVRLTVDDELYYFCLSEPGSSQHYLHQGNSTWLALKTEKGYVKTFLMPLWLQIIMIIVLLVFSGLFSGLNLGLMSLDKTEIDIMINSGTEKEKRYAKTIRPLRKRGNFLLCTILLGNVLVNNTLAILLDDLTGSGIAAVVSATLAIVIFGEIIPQAFCSRYGLAVGARTAWFTRFFMFITFPLSYPISRVLDCALGEEIGYVYNRDRLRELLRLTEKEMDLVRDEVNIITGALELSKKTVGNIMTKLEDVFMVESNAILDFDTVSLIMKTGYTRIPIYEKERSNIVALLNIKDLAFIDPDDRTPLRTVTQFYKHPVNFVFEDTRLNVMLEEFKKGRSHLALVQKVNSDGPGDPFYEIIGLLTLEDIIEEIFQCEIVDETDTVYDNRRKAPRQSHIKDFSVFNQPDMNNYIRLSPQLALATFQFLSTSVPPFKLDLISDAVLHKLIKQNVIVNLRLDANPNSDERYLYKAGRQCDYFILILQGRVLVELGKENLTFEAGPFMHFGVHALIGSPSQSTLSLSRHISQTSLPSLNDQTLFNAFSIPYIPDYSVHAITDLQYMLIRRAHYLVARRATLVERHPKMQSGQGTTGAANGRLSPSMTGGAQNNEDQFDKEWQRVAMKNHSLMKRGSSESVCDGIGVRSNILDSTPVEAQDDRDVERTKRLSNDSHVSNDDLSESRVEDKSLLNETEHQEDIPLIVSSSGGSKDSQRGGGEKQVNGQASADALDV